MTTRAAGGHVPGSSARCDQCRRRRKKCDLSEPQCQRCEKSGLRCSGPRQKAMFVHRYAESFNSQTQRTALVQAYQRRLATMKHSRQFFDTTMLWLRYLRSLLAERQWSSSLAMGQNVILSHQASHDCVYRALVGEFEPRKQGIFSGDRMESAGPKHYSNIATCIRALLPLSTLRIPILDQSLLSLLSLYYSGLHSDTGLQGLAYSSYTIALGQYSRLLTKVLSNGTEVSPQAYQAFIYISISLQMFEYLRGVEAQSTEHQAHLHGALEALHGCGPQALQKSSGMQRAFCGLRGAAVYVAMEKREQSFLAEPEWLIIPFHNMDKSTRDCLTDLGVHIPGLLKRADVFWASTTSDYTPQHLKIGTSLLAKVTGLQHDLEGWLATVQAATSEPLYWSRKSPVTSDNKPHDTECVPKYSNNFHQLCFPCGPVAGLLVQYWSFALQLSMTSIGLQKSLLSYIGQVPDQVLGRETLSRGLQKEQAQADSIAQLILEAEPFVSSCFEGLICLQSPLRIVERYFKSTIAQQAVI